MIKFLRFRLRTLLLGMMLLGGIGGWLVSNEQEHRREIALVEKVCGERKVPTIEFKNLDGFVLASIYDRQFWG